MCTRYLCMYMYSTVHENALKSHWTFLRHAQSAYCATRMYVVNSVPESTRNTRGIWSIFCHTDEAECKCHCAQVMLIHECLNLLCNVHYNSYTCLLIVFNIVVIIIPVYMDIHKYTLIYKHIQLDYTQCTQNANYTQSYVARSNHL